MRSTWLLCSAFIVAALSQPASGADLMTFWSHPVHGGNVFNGQPKDAAYYRALADTGADWVRLTFSKWKGKDRDFLIGNADNYQGLVVEDLAILRAELDAAHAASLKVVIAPLTLPGTRWAQLNGGSYDDRLWSDATYHDQAVRFWIDLATALKDHPGVAAYNLINEPAPERRTELGENASDVELRSWQAKQSDTSRDLLQFYEKVIAGIRQVDGVTPVMVDSGWYANPRSLAAWPRTLSDDRVLYAFHMYEPYDATSSPNMKRDVPLRYPGVTTAYAGGKTKWDREAVATHIDMAFDWAKSHDLPPTRVVAAEFGCMRLWEDCERYLTDVLDGIEAHGSHWAFYSFREDVWDGMDYELPASVTPGQFYWLSEQGKADRLPRDGKLMGLLRNRMKN